MTTRKTTDPREQLITAGLLPNPNRQNSWASFAASPATEENNPLLDLYEQNQRTLAARLLSTRTRLHHADHERAAQALLAIRRAAALEWLRNEYDLDDLALDVIAHVLIDNPTRVAS